MEKIEYRDTRLRRGYVAARETEWRPDTGFWILEKPENQPRKLPSMNSGQAGSGPSAEVSKVATSETRDGKAGGMGKLEGWNVGTAGQKSESFDRNRNFLTISSILS